MLFSNKNVSSTLLLAFISLSARSPPIFVININYDNPVGSKESPPTARKLIVAGMFVGKTTVPPGNITCAFSNIFKFRLSEIMPIGTTFPFNAFKIVKETLNSEFDRG